MARIGITGHQRLEDPAAWPWVEEVVGRELDAAAAPLVVVTSLAVGADQLAARLGIARGATVHAVLPFSGIERTFSAEDLQAYRRLVSQASVEVLQTSGTDEDAYLAWPARCGVVGRTNCGLGRKSRQGKRWNR